jgi:hypothetical protein
MEFVNTEISAKSFLENYKPKIAPVISRGQYLSMFYHKLSQDWNGVEPLSRLRVGVAMKRFNTNALPSLWAVCNDSKSFAKMFWWKVKQMPVPPRKKKMKTLQLFKG